MKSSSVPRRARSGGSRPQPDSLEPLWDAVRDLHLILRGATQAALTSRGLLVSEYHTLALCENGPVPLKSITEGLGVTPAATTDLVRRLESRRFIRVGPHQTDRRSRIASLTPAGHRILRQSREAKRKALRELGVEISPTGRRALLQGVVELREAHAVTRGHRGREG